MVVFLHTPDEQREVIRFLEMIGYDTNNIPITTSWLCFELWWNGKLKLCTLEDIDYAERIAQYTYEDFEKPFPSISCTLYANSVKSFAKLAPHGTEYVWRDKGISLKNDQKYLMSEILKKGC